MGIDLRGAELQKANFTGCDLTGANLEGAKLDGCNFRWATLEGAGLEGASLRDADLSDARLDVESTTSVYYELENKKRRVTKRAKKIYLGNTRISELTLLGADLGFFLTNVKEFRLRPSYFEYHGSVNSSASKKTTIAGITVLRSSVTRDAFTWIPEIRKIIRLIRRNQEREKSRPKTERVSDSTNA
jgi:hypothetical protein